MVVTDTVNAMVRTDVDSGERKTNNRKLHWIYKCHIKCYRNIPFLCFHIFMWRHWRVKIRWTVVQHALVFDSLALAWVILYMMWAGVMMCVKFLFCWLAHTTGHECSCCIPWFSYLLRRRVSAIEYDQTFLFFLFFFCQGIKCRLRTGHLQTKGHQPICRYKQSQIRKPSPAVQEIE